MACVPIGVGPPSIGVIPPGVDKPPGVVPAGVLPPGVAACGVSSHLERRFPPPGVGVIPGVSAPIRSVLGVSAHPGVLPGVSVPSTFGVSSQRFALLPKMNHKYTSQKSYSPTQY